MKFIRKIKLPKLHFEFLKKIKLPRIQFNALSKLKLPKTKIKPSWLFHNCRRIDRYQYHFPGFDQIFRQAKPQMVIQQTTQLPVILPTETPIPTLIPPEPTQADTRSAGCHYSQRVQLIARDDPVFHGERWLQ